MKKLILLSVIASVMPLASLAQDDDDMYFVPTKANVAKSAAEYGIPQNTYYSGSQRSVDDYNRRGSQFVPIDSAGNDIIDFSAEQGVYPDSLYDESADFQYARRMSRFDDYNWSDPYWAGYYAGRSSRWYSPWYYDSWYDPWYYGYGYYGYGYGYYGWYSPWYYNSWYSPYYYGYYGGRPYYASRSVYRRGNGTLNHIRYSNSNSNNSYRGGLRTGSFGGSRMQTGTFGTTTRRSSTSGFGGSRSSFDNSSSTRSYSSPNRSTGSFNNNSSTGSSSSFGGSRSSGSFGGSSSSGGSFGGSRSAGGFGGRR